MATRSFGGVQVSRTYYTRGQTGQQLQVAASQALLRQVAAGTVTLHTRQEMLDLIVADGRAQGIVVRDLVTGEITAQTAHAVVLATGGYGTVYFQSTLARNCNATASWRAHRRGALLASPSFIQFHPTALPVSAEWQSKTTLMSESLRNDGRIWVPKKEHDDRPPGDIPDAERDYYLERRYPAYGNLTPRDVASRAAVTEINSGHGVGPLHNSVYLDFADALARLGKSTISERYGNLFSMYRDATGEDPYEVPMRIAPAAHFTMGGLWSDFDQMSSIPGLFVGGEVGWGYHGANRLGASALMQGLADGYFVLPYTIGDYLSHKIQAPKVKTDTKAFDEAEKGVKEKIAKLLAINGKQSVDDIHKKLGHIMWENVGMARTKESLEKAITEIQALRKEFWKDVKVVGKENDFNVELEKALRLADFLELGELMARDALNREESCGGHFRTEHQTEEGEAKRDDENFVYAAVWEYKGMDQAPELTKEPLNFEFVHPAQRNYKD